MARRHYTQRHAFTSTHAYPTLAPKSTFLVHWHAQHEHHTAPVHEARIRAPAPHTDTHSTSTVPALAQHLHSTSTALHTRRPATGPAGPSSSTPTSATKH